MPSRLLVPLVVLARVLAAAPAAAQDPGAETVRAAVARAVAARFGSDAAVTVEEVHLSLAKTRPAGEVSAHPDPGARLGGAVKFALRWGDGRYAGEADAVVRVEASCARALRDLARGTTLASEDFEIVRGEIERGFMRPCPTDLAGTRLLRGLSAGDVVPAAAVSVAPLVRSGDRVTTRVRMGGIEVSGKAVASQSGELGDVIRLVNPESGRAIRARITARGEVEVIHGS